MYDVIVVGAGPAGLSAALMLGRCRRTVLLCDTGQPRNASSKALHGYLTRDGVAPQELLAIGRRELERYETVEFRVVEVCDACWRKEENRFEVVLATGERVRSRKLLLATGVADKLPEIAGIHELYGKSVFHCPYCDGWEVRDQSIAIYGRGEKAHGLALELTIWSRDLVLCTNGPCELRDKQRERLERNGIALREDPIVRLEGDDGILRYIVFENGERLPRRAMFFTEGQFQHSHLCTTLGCEFNDKGTVRTGKYESTHLPGLFVCGDASRRVQWVIVAAAEGAEAAFAINTDLLKDDLG
jgi:thioredoxin reductase